MGLFSRLFSKVEKESATSKLYIQGTGQAAWMERDYEAFSREGYTQNVIAHRAIAMIAEGVASVPLLLFRGKTELSEHPLLKLLKKPNAVQSGADFIRSVISYYLLAGNSYIEAAYPGGDPGFKNTPPVFLYTQRPDRMSIIRGQGNIPAFYRFTLNGFVDFPVTIMGESNILHIKAFHPINDWYGLSPVEAAAYSIDQHNESSKWNKALLQNGARPSGALMVEAKPDVPANLSDDTFSRIKNELSEQYSGSLNSGRPMLLEGGLKWQEMSLNPKEMDFREGRNAAAREIALAFGVPPQLLGIPGDNTYSNYTEARMAFWEQTLLPTLDMLLDKLNGWLIPRYGDNLELIYDKDAIEALAPKRQMMWNMMKDADFVTDNEKREALDYDAVEGGDVIYKPASMQPAGTQPAATQPPAETTQTQAQKDYIDRLTKSGIDTTHANYLADIMVSNADKP